MKRKLNDRDVPEEATQASNASVSFGDFGLDARLLQAIAKEKYSAPTPVQAKALPLGIEGRDVLGKLSTEIRRTLITCSVRSRTGSGKTLA